VSYIDFEEMLKIPETELAKVKYKKQYLKSNPKAEELMRFLYALPHDEPVIIWAVNAMEVAYLVDLVGKTYGPDSLVEMHGGVNESDRNTNLQKFTSGVARFLIGNQSVGGVGLNMVNCCIMCYFSNNFSLRTRIQSEGRIERMGQLRPMLYVDFACSNSIDGYVVSALKDKNDFAETIRAAFDSGQLLEVI
jgi:SNF2 family DNA or RNA helicase